MKKLLFKIAFIVFCVISGTQAQQQDQFLISIDLDKVNDKNALETIGLSAYHIFEKDLISIVSLDQIQTLQRYNIGFALLDGSTVGKKYYLVTSKRTSDKQFTVKSGKILFDGGRTKLISSGSDEMKDLDNTQYSSIELNPSSNKFKNITIHSAAAVQSDSGISSVVSEIRPDSVRYFIQSLQNFKTRYCLAQNRDSVAYWLRDQFLRMGFTDVKIDSFQILSTWQKNVVATLPGVINPDQIVVVGGHHDSYSSGSPAIVAPGADDNASGTTAVLEMARVMKQKGFQPKSTIKFITFAAEELGLYGSQNYAQKAKLSGMNIVMMVNHDMISTTLRSLSTSFVNINYYTGVEFLREFAITITQQYSTIAAHRGDPNSSGSDSYSFWNAGFPAVYFEEGDFSPVYHTPQDVIGNCNMDYCAEVIKASCALVMSGSAMPSMVKNFVLSDAGNGTSLIARWTKDNAVNFKQYKVYVGKSSGIYDSIFTTTATNVRIDHLIEGIPYYIGISSIDDTDNESYRTERVLTPHTKPLVPQNVSANPKFDQVQLRWNANKENDLIGYNIYRATTSNGIASQLNSTVVSDTAFNDKSAVKGQYYYYTIAAVDSAKNESGSSLAVRSKVLSYDQGILVVDDTRDGTGTVGNPTGEEVNQYFTRLLSGYKTGSYDLETEKKITLADMGAYSSILWHGNIFGSSTIGFESGIEIIKYLQNGGNIFIACYRPVSTFLNSNLYPNNPAPQSFVYSILKIKHVELLQFSRFIGAEPMNAGYPSIYVDTAKTPSANNHHLSTIEGLTALAGSQEIYSYQTNYDTMTTQGKMKGNPVGVEYLGNDYKSVVVSFPLYFMKEEQAKSLVKYVLTEKFSETTRIKDNKEEIPSDYWLMQNYPNPFNPVTMINYQLPMHSTVTLKVYDIIGREVVTLVNDVKEAGEYSVKFDGSKLSSGMYIYKLTAGKFTSVKKMILMK